MKEKAILVLSLILTLEGLSPWAAVVETYDFTGLNQSIPDGSPVGASDVRNVPSAITSIAALKVTLNIAGNFNGDLYAYVRHESGFSVLLNRPGRTASDSLGYDDAGFQVTFQDVALNGDIHLYRSKQTPAEGNPLTGLWEPDARNVDPAVVLDTSPRSAFLNSFNGLNAAGTWTLFVADLESGGTSTLNSWGLEIIPVPEPPGALLATSLLLIGLAATRLLLATVQGKNSPKDFAP